LGHVQETKTKNPWHKKGAEIQTKSIENLFNEIRDKNFPNLEKEIDTHVF
jgi:hypothetical protein